MTCPHGDAGDTNRRRRRTSLGYRTFACRACRRVFHERSGTPLNDRHYPTDVVLLAVLRQLRDTRSCRDIAAMLLERGCSVTPETIRAWECRFAPRVTARRRAKRRGRAGRAWSLDETDVQVAGRWCSRDRALDRARAPSGTPGAARTATSTPGAARPAAPGGRGRAHAAAQHDGPASAVPQSDPLDSREEGPAPMPPGLEPPHRAQPPGGAAALRPHAGLRQFRVRRPLLYRVR